MLGREVDARHRGLDPGTTSPALPRSVTIPPFEPKPDLLAPDAAAIAARMRQAEVALTPR